MTTLTAAQRRALLANAHAKYFSSHRNQNATKALRDTLHETGLMQLTDSIQNVELDSTTICVTIETDNFVEAIEIDAYGNVLRGAV